MALILDVRPATAFTSLHRSGAVNIPLEELADRIHELPSREIPLTIYDGDPVRARWAVSRLKTRSRAVADVFHGALWLEEGPTASGESHGRLWQPHMLLASLVERVAELRPSNQGLRALDVGCGTGRDAVFLALSGFQVEAWDVLPDALDRCVDLAGRNGVVVTTRLRDVEADPEIEPGAFDVVCCFNFLHRPLMEHIARAVRPGGFVAYETFVHPQREKFGKPRRDQHLLRPGELPSWFEGWEILVSAEGQRGPRRYAASLIARKLLY